MIYSIIIILLLSWLLSIHSFYVKNAAIVEQCSAGTNFYLNKFDSNKMRCYNNAWRQVNIYLTYKCKLRHLTPNWTIQTSNTQYPSWPSQIHVLIDTGKIINKALSMILFSIYYVYKSQQNDF